MPIVYVTSNEPGSGKTGVAVAIARHFAYLGVPVRLTRVASEPGNAIRDAAFFGDLDFVPGSPTAPVEASALVDPGSRELLVAEGDADAAPAGAQVVLTGNGTVPSAPAGLNPAVIVVTNVAPSESATIPATAGESPVVALTSDRTLAGFEVETVRDMLNAEVLVRGEPMVTTCDSLVVAPIGSDAGQPYFRRFRRPCVVVRYDKTDQHLAALRGDALCLVLTGGRRPSDYTIDAGNATGVPVFLSRTDTENTVILLEGLFDETRFWGEAKLDRMSELLEGTALFDAIVIEAPTAAG